MKIKYTLLFGIAILLSAYRISATEKKNIIHEDGLMSIMNTMMTDMKTMNMGGNPDHDFAMMMMRHHKAAIEMAHHELQNGKDETMKKKAQEIADKQTKEMEDLNVRMKEDKDMGKTNPKFKQEIMQNVEQSDAKMKSQKMTGDEDKDFAMMMKMHHEMAIDMANIYYKSATDNKIGRAHV